jgi:hypothetical protein
MWLTWEWETIMKKTYKSLRDFYSIK